MTLRTRVYVDGYNLYYGCVRNTPHKWLDIQALTQRILDTIRLDVDGEPAAFCLDPLAVKYFTAAILKNFARHEDSVPSQAAYHQALRGHLGPALSLIEGYFAAEPARAHRHVKGQPARDCELVDIWKLVEKQSDVALALHGYGDALRGEVDHVVFVTNDTDVVPCLDLIRAHTAARIGLIIPTRAGVRSVNNDLSCRADWVRSHVLEDELASCQLPSMVMLDGRPVHKPLSWYPRPDLLAPLLAEAIRVKRSRGAALKWMNMPCAQLGGQRPIDMAASDAGALALRVYMDRYAADFGLQAEGPPQVQITPSSSDTEAE
ncbi:antitoxin Xre/MbcA/ParS toxin-binding domain-containing protein [Aquimonas sp.]|uniref:antitoxin Xre/MbcA/ParS toxin-binding domain-containing protein n=1 Tax=Aquimonas sp. TaxID=1872588 RepID=UPI0037C081CA